MHGVGGAGRQQAADRVLAGQDHGLDLGIQCLQGPPGLGWIQLQGGLACAGVGLGAALQLGLVRGSGYGRWDHSAGG